MAVLVAVPGRTPLMGVCRSRQMIGEVGSNSRRLSRELTCACARN